MAGTPLTQSDSLKVSVRYLKKQTITTREDEGAETTTTTYYVRSSVLGNKSVAELDASGNWKSNPIYIDGMIVAYYSPSPIPSNPDNVWWQHLDPARPSISRIRKTGSRFR